MKVNFVVSGLRALWISNASALFALDPYVVHVLEREGGLETYDQIEVADHSCSPEQLEADCLAIEQKHRRYLDILTQRLQRLHGEKYSAKFWMQLLSLPLLRHIGLCHQIFSRCEENFVPARHAAQILSVSSYNTPPSFDEYRKFVQHSDFGYEQLFSVYCHLFYPDECSAVDWQYRPTEIPAQSSYAGKKPSILRYFSPKSWLRRLFALRQPKIGILNSFFSAENLDYLVFRGLGRVKPLGMPDVPLSSVATLDANARALIAEPAPDFDRFDTFCFEALRHLMPKSMVEDFSRKLDAHQKFYARYGALRWVISEAWLSDEATCFALAVLRERNVKLAYNEHNYLAYPFVGNNLKYIFPIVDRFVTLGWQNPGINNLVAGGSLFHGFQSETKPTEGSRAGLLLISSLPNVRAPELNTSYGESGPRVVPGYLDMNRRFLSGLSEDSLRSLYFRAYPAHVTKKSLVWDQRHELRDFISRLDTYDELGQIPVQTLLAKTSLVIVNYLSTAYLEALLADIPTIILVNCEAYQLEMQHKAFFAPLITAGICQTDPDEAAAFVEKIKQDPLVWWNSPDVKSAKNRFLSANLGEPQGLFNYLLSLD